jgi:glycosyltransferase involved in cell wall biosynthesis
VSHSILYIFRKTSRFFSLENVFGPIIEQMGRSGEFEPLQVKVPREGFSAGTLWANSLFVRRARAALFHVTGDIHYVTLLLPAKKTVLTIHDCVFMNQPAGPKRWLLKKLLLDWPVAHCRCITTISENTRNDVLRYTGCSPDKIHVIPNFIDPGFRPGPPVVFRGRPRILFVGTTENKNLDRLAQAMEGLPAELDIIGTLDEHQKACLQRYNIVYTQCAGISKEALMKHYHDCDLVAFPSTFEGFGLPILEGQAVGKPVLTSAVAPMREVAGDGACLVDPYDAGSIREGLLRIIRNPGYRDSLVRSGLANAGKYSLGNIVAAYTSLYTGLLEK